MPDRIYALLKHRILTCALQPGDRVIEKDICAELKVSRTPLREALNRLASEGLVALAAYRGYTITQVTIKTIRELCEVRFVVESAVAGLAAERATSEQIEELFQRAELRYRPGDRKTYADYLRANSAFHLALVRCANNERLEGLVMSVLDQLQRPLYLGLDQGLDAEAATAEHLELAEAVRARDAALAREINGRAIIQAEGRIISVLQTAGF